MTEVRIEFDSMGAVEVPVDKLWGAQTQRSLKYFSIGRNLMPPEMILAYAALCGLQPLLTMPEDDSKKPPGS
jgi:fumarate hydratase, class II